jgi:hypothetical protein
MSVMIFVGLMALLGTGADVAQDPAIDEPQVVTQPYSAASFMAADDATKARILGALATSRINLRPPELADVVSAALSHPDARIRRGGLSVLAGRSGGVRLRGR